MAIITASIANAQIAQWIIQPDYDKIDIAEGAPLIISESNGESTLWTFDGEKLAFTQDHIMPFVEDLAVTTYPDSIYKVTGFFDTKGQFTNLKDGHYELAYKYNRFSNHLLLVKNENGYDFIGTDGKPRGLNFKDACPFLNDYAICVPKNTQYEHYVLLNKDLQPVRFVDQSGQPIDPERMTFISSINDEGIGIAVVKDKLFTFEVIGKPNVMTLKPMYAHQDYWDGKHQAEVEDWKKVLTYDYRGYSTLPAKCGDEGNIIIQLNTFSAPVSIKYVNGERVFKPRTIEQQYYTSKLRVKSGLRNKAIWWGDSLEILAPQFDEVGTRFDEKVCVKLNGKWGLIKTFKDEKFTLLLNEGKLIDFRHATYDTKVRVDLPKAITPASAELMMVSENGRIDTDSKLIHGNSIQYKCDLYYPNELKYEGSDVENSVTVINYDVQVQYDNLKSPVFSIQSRSLASKYISLNLTNQKINNNHYTATLTLNKEKKTGEPDYPLSVNCEVEDRYILDNEGNICDSVVCKTKQLSKTKYLIDVQPLRDGVNNLIITISEKGVPDIIAEERIKYSKAKKGQTVLPNKALETKKRTIKRNSLED